MAGKSNGKRFVKFIKFGLLGVYVLLIAFLVIQGLTPGNESAKISTGIGNGIDKLLSEIKSPVASSVPAESVSIVRVTVNEEVIDSTSVTVMPGSAGVFSCSVLPEKATNKSLVFTSSDKGVTVDALGNFKAVYPCSAVIKAASFENPSLYAELNVTVSEIPVTDFELKKIPSSLYVGQKAVVSASFVPENATTGKTLLWESDDTGVATVSDGTITACGEGTVNITAKLFIDEDKTFSFSLIVRPMPEPVEDTKRLTSFEMVFHDVGEQPATNHLTDLPELNDNGEYVVYVGDKYYISPVPDNPSYSYGYVWSTSDIDVATHDGKKTLTFKEAGKVTITVSSKKYSVTQKTVFRVKDIVEDKITLFSDDIAITETENGVFYAEIPVKTTAEISYSAGTAYISVGHANDVATVKETAEKNTAVITAREQGDAQLLFDLESDGVTRTAVLNLKVIENAYYRPISEIIAENDFNLDITEKERIVEYSMNDASMAVVAFSSSDENVLTVDEFGRITPVSTGEAIVTVKGVDVFDPDSILPSDTVKITVTKEPVTEFSISESTRPTEMDVGEKYVMRFNINGSIRSVICESSDVSVMKVTTFESGNTMGATLNAVAAGTVTITAKAKDDPNLTDEITITVNPVQIALNGIKASKNALEIANGKSEKFTVSFNPAQTTFKGIMLEISDESIVSAEYDAAKKTVTVKGLKKGTASVTVRSDTYDDVYLTVDVTVIEILSETIKVTTKGLKATQVGYYKIKLNESASISAILDKNATIKTVAYSSSDENVATVGEDGILAIKSAGETVITVSTTDGENTVSNNFLLVVERITFKDTITDFYYIVRKSIGHFGAFLVLGILAAFSYLFFSPKSIKAKTAAGLLCMASGFTVAGITEMCQLPAFTTGRYCSFNDVILDFSGYAGGAFAVFAAALAVWLVSFAVKNVKTRRAKAEIFAGTTGAAISDETPANENSGDVTAAFTETDGTDSEKGEV
ncbi:MAG: VanZ family protein [Clostridia bacterium]|nr:VanZ family protein [Clostridia bacterium]